LVESAQAGELDIGPRLEACFAGTVPGPAMGYWGQVLSWKGTALIAVASEPPPLIALDGGDPVPMTAVPGTPYWFKLEHVEEGRVRSYKLVVDGVWADGREFPGYLPLSHELPDVRPGTMSEKRTVESRIYPGATTEYWVYANHGIDEVRGAPVMVCHDGSNQ